MQKLKKKKITEQNKWSGKPYNFFGDYLFEKYACHVLKLPVNAGLSCPNRDGTLGTDGCIFCSEEGSASPTSLLSTSITGQMANAVSSFRRAYKKTKFIAYLQAFTNTYGDVNLLKKVYDEAVSFPDVIGLMIGTRPDCIDNKVLDLINSYKKENFELWVELGLQSVHNKSLAWLGRRHSWESTLNSINLLAGYGIDVCVHVIIGIPGETWNDIMKTAEMISELPVSGVKIHHLHVIKGTRLEKEYTEGKVPLLSLNEYISILCDFLERLRPDITIHRLAGDRAQDTLVAPGWGLHKGTVMQSIINEFTSRYTYQGFLCKNDEESI